MARPLLSSQYILSLPSFSSSTSTTLLLLLAGIAAVASIILSLCTAHKHSKHKYANKNNNKPLPPPPPPPPPQCTAERKFKATLSGIGSKALVVAKMVSWKKGGGEGDEDGEEELWRKSILMGEKCRPLDFSGQILYDSEGNEVTKEEMHHHKHARVQVEKLSGEN